jgi:hypothetical protein
MAMDKETLVSDVTDALKQRMYDDLNPPETATVEDFAPLATVMAEEIVGAIIQHILDNAETDPGGESIE